MAKENVEKIKKENTSKNYKGNVTMFIAGIFIAVTGYLLLTQTNKSGDNWASYVSAFSIIIGYIVVALSLIIDFPPSKN
ncbi:MAG: hypothetical protein AB1498_10605 [bacterium]